MKRKNAKHGGGYVLLRRDCKSCNIIILKKYWRFFCFKTKLNNFMCDILKNVCMEGI